MTHTIPAGYTVRYDYHTHPVATTAVVLDPDGRIAAVGVAKFSPKDEVYVFNLGEQIALGRALRHIHDGRGLHAVRTERAPVTPLATRGTGYGSGDPLRDFNRNSPAAARRLANQDRALGRAIRETW